MQYSYNDYWRNLHRREDLSGVGQSALPGRTNTWIYRTKARNLRSFALAHGLVADPGARLLDVGVGTGYWVPTWRALGYHVEGCDLVEAAVEGVRRADPAGRYWRADISDPQGILSPEEGGGYDLVTAIDVLLHVTRDSDFQQALANVAGAVKPGGQLLLVEPALTLTKRQKPYDPSVSSRARVLRSYRRPLRRLGLRLVTVRATTVLAGNPLESATKRRARAYARWWQAVASTREHPARIWLLGPLMYALDWLLLRTGEAPTSKVLLFRRVRPSTGEAPS